MSLIGKALQLLLAKKSPLTLKFAVFAKPRPTPIPHHADVHVGRTCVNRWASLKEISPYFFIHILCIHVCASDSISSCY